MPRRWHSSAVGILGEGAAAVLAVVLVVEDTEKIGAALVKLLQELGAHDVRWARSVAEAKGLVSPPLELVLLDIVLPDDAPYPVVAAVRERAPEARIIAMSAQAERSQVAALMHLGAHGYIEKPVTKGKLLGCIAGIDVRELAEPRIVDLARTEGVPEAQRFVRDAAFRSELHASSGNISEAARRSGITRIHAHRLIKKQRSKT